MHKNLAAAELELQQLRTQLSAVEQELKCVHMQQSEVRSNDRQGGDGSTSTLVEELREVDMTGKGDQLEKVDG